MFRSLVILSAFCTAAFAATLGPSSLAAGAAGLDNPTGEIVLTVEGDIPDAVGEAVAFDLEMLQAMDLSEFATHTIWTEGEQVFQGVAVAELLDALSIEDGTIRAVALNDYAVDIPVSEIDDDAPIIAYHRNGAPMSVRDKGPLWLVYPYDRDPVYRTEITYQRSIWQLVRFEILQ